MDGAPVKIVTREGILLAVGRIKNISGSEKAPSEVRIKPDVVLK
jgi:hypothetical protein